MSRPVKVAPLWVFLGVAAIILPQNAAGQRGTSHAVQSTIPQNPQPSISSLSPTSATAGSRPTTVTINGSGFIGASSVTFNGVSHAASLRSASQLTITLSAAELAAASSFPVVVTNPTPGGGASNLVNFAVQPGTQNPQPLVQRVASHALTLRQVEDLMSLGVPDSTVHAEIQKRGLAFTPDPALLASLRAKGAGPLTLADIKTLIPKASLPTAALDSGRSHTDRGDPMHACALIDNQDYSNQIISPTTSWTQLNRGQERDGYSFSTNGSLFYLGQMLTNNIPVSGSSDNHWIYAQSIALSSKSPSGRSAILQACAEPNWGGLCWALFVVDHGSLHIERTFAGKYGPERWVAWIRGVDEYAVLRYKDEGMTTYYRIHLPTGQSAECAKTSSTR